MLESFPSLTLPVCIYSQQLRSRNKKILKVCEEKQKNVVLKVFLSVVAQALRGKMPQKNAQSLFAQGRKGN